MSFIGSCISLLFLCESNALLNALGSVFILKMAVVNPGSGKSAITDYRVLHQADDGTCLILCDHHTGRTHQIRVHMSAIGHSLMGDPLYGRASPARKARFDEDQQKAIAQFPRQALHAAVLGFVHPITKDFVRFESELPSDMENLINALS